MTIIEAHATQFGAHDIETINADASTSSCPRCRQGRVAKSCRRDESTARQPRGAGCSITSRKRSPQVQMRCCLTRWARRSSKHLVIALLSIVDRRR